MICKDTGVGGHFITLFYLDVNPDKQQRLAGLKTGDIILIGTDGAWEARSPEGEMFGKDRIKSIVQQNAGRCASDILQEIVAALTAFQESPIPADDVTLVVVKFTA
jgi:sigma-B regulation protein RsbU (phosphoserine phosphatase)